MCSPFWVRSKTIWMWRRKFVQHFGCKAKNFCSKHFGCEGFVQILWMRSKTFVKYFRCEGNLSFVQHFWCEARVFIQTFLMPCSKTFCSMLTTWAPSKTFVRTIWVWSKTIVQQWMWRSTSVQMFAVQSKAFIHTFLCKARLLSKLFCSNCFDAK